MLPTSLPDTSPMSLPAESTKPRLLVIAPNWIGDAVMAQPLLQLLKQQHPEHAIDVLAAAWVAPVVRAMAEVDQVLETPFRHGALQLRQRWRFARALSRRGYSAAYILPNTLKFALLPWFAGIPLRVGYQGESRYGLINRMHHDEPGQPRAMVNFYAALAFAPSAHFDQKLPTPLLSLAPEARLTTLRSLGLSEHEQLICFGPGAEFGPSKRWPPEHFATLANLILRHSPHAQIVLLGSPKDAEVCAEIKALCPPVHALAGQTSLTQALALLSGATAVVSNDSGLLHIASAFNRPVLAIYGSTDPDHAPPFSQGAKSFSLRLACAPCKQRDCPLGHHDCMRKLAPDLLWPTLQALLPAAAR